MTAIELKDMKIELAKTILDMDSEEDIKRIRLFVNNFNKEHPCTYTFEEIRERADLADYAIQAYQRGGDKTRFVSHEEMMKKHPL